MPGIRKDLTWTTNKQGCMLVTSHAKDKFGYVWLRRKGKSSLMHRVIYELHNGPIPAGMVVRHTCDNPSCIRINHLIIGTVGDNNKDRDLRGRTAKGERNAATKLTEDQVLQIRSSSKPSRRIAREFNIGQTTVQSIRKRRTWKHLESEKVNMKIA